MRRRDFIKVIAGSAAAWPLVAHAQQAEKLPRVGFLGLERTTPVQIDLYRAFSSQLEKNGLREGQNIIVEYRAIYDPRGPFVGAAELLRAQPDLLVAAGPEVALQAVIGASGHIPIVMLAVNFDPIERGYVASLAQPGGNITGVIVRPLELARKQIDLLRQAFPDRNRFGRALRRTIRRPVYFGNSGGKFTESPGAGAEAGNPILRLRWRIRSRGERRSAVYDGAVESCFHPA